MELIGAPSLYANIPILNIKNDVNTKKSEEQKNVKNEDESANIEVIEFRESETIIEGNSVTNNNNDDLSSSKSIDDKGEFSTESENISDLNSENTSTETDDNDSNSENVEPVLDFYDDEEDYDITFDDLLKKAEEDAMQDNEIKEKVDSSFKGINQKPIRNNKKTKQKKRQE